MFGWVERREMGSLGLRRRVFASSAMGRARPEPQTPSQASSYWVEFEDSPPVGCCHWIVELDPIDDADELDTERNTSRERAEDIAEVPNPLRRVQFGRGYIFCPAPHSDGRAASSAQVAYPLGLAPGGPDPTPTPYRNNR